MGQKEKREKTEELIIKGMNYIHLMGLKEKKGKRGIINHKWDQ